MSILQKLAEGSMLVGNVNDITIDPTIESQIDDSSLSMYELIESVYIHTQADIYQAMEVYETSDILTKAKILVEGRNYQPVTENFITDFFGKIIEKLRQIKDWFVGIIRKITRRGGDEATTIAKNVDRIMPEVKEKVSQQEDEKEKSSTEPENKRTYVNTGTVKADPILREGGSLPPGGKFDSNGNYVVTRTHTTPLFTDQEKKELQARQKEIIRTARERKLTSSSSTTKNNQQRDYIGPMWNRSGDTKYDKSIKVLEDILGSCQKFLDSMSRKFPMGKAAVTMGPEGGREDYNMWDIRSSVDKNMPRILTDEISNPIIHTSDDICKKLGKEVFDDWTLKDTATLSKKVQTSYGIVSDGKYRAKPANPTLIRQMEDDIKANVDIQKTGNHAIKTFNGRCKDLESSLKKIKEECEFIINKTHEKGQQTNMNKLSKYCSDVISTVNSISSVYAQVINAKTVAYLSIIKQYNAFLNGIAKGTS